ncbi:MAG TPA: BatA domain-containing protein [Pyrinomonadaceae bacterium]|nr:BatA domain-containing protein [Pyrinomonadaceae bacterium]
MTFLAPLTLICTLLVALPLAIHLLVRRRARRLDFPSLKFLRETPSFKLYPRRIRQPWLLALRAAAIILLVLGLARPFLTFRKQPTPVRFILMDASLSMKSRGRADAAREQARAIINKLSGNERAAIIAFSSEAKTLSETTADRSKLLEAIERYQPDGGATRYDAGIAEVVTQQLREPQAASEVDLISDFQQAGLEEPFALGNADQRIVLHPVGSQVDRNAFLTDESVEKNERGVQLSATEIISETDGRSGARHTWTLDALTDARSGIEWRTEANGQLTGRLKVLDADDFDADDERFFAFQPPRETRVLLVEDEGSAGLYLRAALEASSDDGAASVKLDRLRQLPDNEAVLASYSLVVLTLHGAARENEASVLTQYARAGGTVWMFLARDLDAESWSALARREEGRELPFEGITRISGQRLSFGAADTDAPQLRALGDGALASLRAVRINAGYALAPRVNAATLMRWNDGSPAFVSTRVGEGSIMLLATAPERASSEMGASPSFPALASSILRSTSVMREPPSRTIGEAVRLNVAPETSVKITNMEGRVSETKARELVRQPLAYFGEAGIYRLEFAGGQKFLAFNSESSESERALATVDKLKQFFSVEKRENSLGADTGNSGEALERSGSTWRYFLIAAFLLMIAELFVAMRQHKIAADNP